jgi:hypothetical protein
VSAVVGVELGTDGVRAVALGSFGRRPTKTVELPWDPAHPEQVVEQLHARLGPARRLSLSVSLGFLHVKRVKLPPAPADERRRMIALEPSRFFPVQGGRLAVALPESGDFAFAMDAELQGRWVLAFKKWAPVDAVEATPTSLQRALGPSPDGIYALPAGPEEEGVVELAGGRFRSARRAPRGTLGAAPLPLPTREGVPADFLCAWGAALGIDGGLDAMLVSTQMAARIRGRRVSRLVTAGAACVLALVFALWALDRSRERTLEALRQEAATLTARAGEAIELQGALAAIDQEREALGKPAGGALDPLPVLAAISQRLPAGATVLNLRATGEDWQMDGTAPDAAAIVPLLDGDDRFHEVRFLSASSRYREGNRTYETFSIAFRVRPTT